MLLKLRRIGEQNYNYLNYNKSRAKKGIKNQPELKNTVTQIKHKNKKNTRKN